MSAFYVFTWVLKGGDKMDNEIVVTLNVSYPKKADAKFLDVLREIIKDKSKAIIVIEVCNKGRSKKKNGTQKKD